METSVTQVFTHEKFGEIRVVFVNGKICFVAADVCRVLGIKNPSDALKRLDADEKMIVTLGSTEVNIVTEPGLYRLIFASRKKDEKIQDFQRWVYHEVIPNAVRGKIAEQSGIYTVNNFPPELSERWAEIKGADVLVKAAKLTDNRKFREVLIRRAAIMVTGEDLMQSLPDNDNFIEI